MAKKSDTFTVPDEWSFNDSDVIEHFDTHVRESLPWFDIATEAVAHIARCFVPRGGIIIDVGAATGNIGRALNPILRQRNALFFPFDSAPGMKEVYRGPGILATEERARKRSSRKNYQSRDCSVRYLRRSYPALSSFFDSVILSDPSGKNPPSFISQFARVRASAHSPSSAQRVCRPAVVNIVQVPR